jgi:hypothetical protein
MAVLGAANRIEFYTGIRRGLDYWQRNVVRR